VVARGRARSSSARANRQLRRHVAQSSSVRHPFGCRCAILSGRTGKTYRADPDGASGYIGQRGTIQLCGRLDECRCLTVMAAETALRGPFSRFARPLDIRPRPYQGAHRRGGMDKLDVRLDPDTYATNAPSESCRQVLKRAYLGAAPSVWSRSCPDTRRVLRTGTPHDNDCSLRRAFSVADACAVESCSAASSTRREHTSGIGRDALARRGSADCGVAGWARHTQTSRRVSHGPTNVGSDEHRSLDCGRVYRARVSSKHG
jgi:hypothetical protein